MANISENDAIVNKGRLYYIEPNDFASYYNVKNENITTNELAWNPEDLSMSVDLQVIIPRREDKGQKNYLMELKNATIQDKNGSMLSRFVSYMGGTPLNQKDGSNSYLTDNYTNISFQEIEGGQIIDSESLGINSIDINFDAHFFPLITMNFTDVRGSSLFMPTEYEFFKSQVDKTPEESASSFFKALFHFPYPRFLLSVKGFYGNKVTFQLSVSDFKSDFQSETGNYNVNVQFIGYVYGLYTDLPLNLIMAAPYYNSVYWEEQQNNGNFTYMSSNGKENGNKILTYAEFIDKVEGKNVTSDALTNANMTQDYVAKKHKIEFLQDIINLYKTISTEPIGNENTFSVRVGDTCSFRWGVTQDNNINKFVMSDDTSKKYYEKIREYLTNFNDPEDEALLNGNIYYDNLYQQLSSITTDVKSLIIKDEKNEYLSQFQTVSGYELKKYLITSATTQPDNSGKTNNVITDNSGLSDLVQSDEILKKDCADGIFSNGHALLKPNNANSGLLVDFNKYITFVTKEITRLKDEIKGEEEELAKELGIVFEEILGFSPTVENFYRMLFAHIDCFMDFYNRLILKQVDDATNQGRRKVKWLGVKLDELDIPKTMKGGNDANGDSIDVFPFPGYFIQKQNTNGTRLVAEFPGESTSERFKSIREVDAVKEIIGGVKQLSKEMKDAINQTPSANTDSTTRDGDAYISMLSVLYGGKNPWNGFDWSNENNVDRKLYKLLYYYICQIIPEKAIGMNINSDGTITESYMNRQIDAILNSGIEFSKEVKDELHTCAVNDVLLSDRMMTYDIMSDYKLYSFTYKSNEKDKTLADKIFIKLKNDNVISFVDGDETNDNSNGVLLNIDDTVLKIPNKQFTNPSVLSPDRSEKYKILTNTDTGYYVIGEDNKITLETNESVPYETLKNINDELVKFDNATKYLKNDVELGEFNVSFLRDGFDYYNFNEVSDLNIDNIYCLSYNSNKKMNWSIPKYAKTPYDKISVTDKVIYTDDNTYSYILRTKNIDENTTSNLVNYYRGNGKKGKVLFVGRKQSEQVPVNIKNNILYNISDQKLLGDAIKLVNGEKIEFNTPPYNDLYTSCNLFSGVLSMWNMLGTKVDDFYDDELPLLYSKRCNTNGVETDIDKTKLSQYTFATYFLALLSGYNGLKTILDDIKKGEVFTPFRKVDILYLGGLLYFTKNNLSVWSKSDEKVVSDLLRHKMMNDRTGELGHGLLYTDESEYSDNLQESYNVDFLFNGNSLTLLGEKLVNKFLSWCDEELFNGVYDMLADNTASSQEYIIVDGFVGKTAMSMAHSKVIAYNKDSVCAKWLTDLYYDYDFIYNVELKEKEEIFISKKIDLQKFLIKLDQKLLEKEVNETLETQSTEPVKQEYNETVDHQRAVYYLLKNLYDKWLCSYSPSDFKLDSPKDSIEKRNKRFCKIENNSNNSLGVSEYENFVYVDQYFNDISSLYMMNVDEIAKILKDTYSGKENIDVYSFMSFMAEKNKLMLMALPVYNNMYNAQSIASVFKPNTLYDNHTYDDNNGIGTTYVVMYTNEVSHHPGEYIGNDYCRDYIDIADLVYTEAGSEDLKFFDISTKNGDTPALNYNISAFAVTYGKQNQMYFKKIDVNMDNPKVTDEAIRNTLMLSEAGTQGDTNQPITIGQNIYSIYANRSYTCTVQMLGCANIMPLMYFQLNNIPMFRGLYMIINVRHTIKAGDMTTVFTGVRVSRYSLPDVSSVLINSSIFNKLEQSDAWKNDAKAIYQDCSQIDSAPTSPLDSKIKMRPMNFNVYDRNNTNIKHIILHYTAGGNSKKCAAWKCYDIWAKTSSASAEFAVDDESIVQFIEDIEHKSSGAIWGSPHNNITNKNSISIEICSNLKSGFSGRYPNHEGWYFTEETLNNAAYLVKLLAKKYNIKLDREHIVRHFDTASGKLCPGIKGWNTGEILTNNGGHTGEMNTEEKYLEFIERLKS